MALTRKVAVLLFNVPSLMQGTVPQTPQGPTDPDFLLHGSDSVPDMLRPSKVSQGRARELLRALAHRVRGEAHLTEASPIISCHQRFDVSIFIFS